MNKKSIFGTLGATTRYENKYEISAYGRTYDNKKIEGVVAGASISTDQKSIQTKMAESKKFVIDMMNQIK